MRKNSHRASFIHKLNKRLLFKKQKDMKMYKISNLCEK